MSSTARNLVLSFALLLLAVPVAAQDWAGRGRALGRVVDQQGDPIEGAKVTLHLPDRPEAGPDAIYTKKNGRWSYLGLDNGPWAVVIEKEGYVTSEGSFQVNEFGTAKPLQIELKKNPFDSVRVGQDLIDQGKYAEARDKLREALPDMDEHQKAQIGALIGNTYYQEGNYAEATQTYEQAMTGLSPEEQTSIRLRLGDSYLQQGQFDKARQTYQATLPALGPEGKQQVLLAIARTYDQEGDRDQAIASVQKILEISPENVQALQLIADLLSRQGKEEEAQKYLDQIPEDEELPADILLNQGIRFYNQQKLDQAMDNFQRVIRQDPNLSDAYYYRGLVYLNKEQNEDAAADFHKLLELAPDSQYASDAKQFLEYLEPQ